MENHSYLNQKDYQNNLPSRFFLEASFLIPYFSMELPRYKKTVLRGESIKYKILCEIPWF